MLYWSPLQENKRFAREKYLANPSQIYYRKGRIPTMSLGITEQCLFWAESQAVPRPYSLVRNHFNSVYIQ